MWKFLDSLHVRRATTIEGLGSFVAMVFSIPGYIAWAFGVIAAVLAYLDGQPRLAIAAAFLAFAFSAAIVLLIVALAVERFWRAASRSGRIASDLPPKAGTGPDAPEGLADVPVQIQDLQKRVLQLAKSWAVSDQAKDKSLETICSDIKGLSDRLVKIETSLQPKNPTFLDWAGVPSFENRLDAIEARIQKTMDYATDEIDRLSKSLGAYNDAQTRLIRALQARDDEVHFQNLDSQVSKLAEKLISAEDYENGATWSRDHNQWGHTLRQIDEFLKQRFGGEWRPFVAVEHHEYERETRNAPDKILVGEAENYRRYKHVCISHDRYLYHRGDVLAYLKHIAHDLPS